MLKTWFTHGIAVGRRSRGAAVALPVAFPLLVMTGDSAYVPGEPLLALMVSVAAFALAAGLLPKGPLLSCFALAALGAALLMAPAAVNPNQRMVVAGLGGFGAGVLAQPSVRAALPALLAGGALAACALLGPLAICRAAAALALAAGLTAWTAPRTAPSCVPGFAAVPCLGIILAASVAYVGAMSPRAGWFGGLTSHGPRGGDTVALTFDDGPNGEYTMAIARILEAHGVKGTFFEVGRAVELQPDVARLLDAQGQILANHSYTHDAWVFLDPRYPEFDRAQSAIERATGRCPAFYRPPRGQHTPLLASVIGSHGGTVVTWDTATTDWSATDPEDLARDILKQVRGGSIILLHDGFEGRPGHDSSVVAAALPIILTGLEARHLRPVGLSELLGRAPYQPPGSCAG